MSSESHDKANSNAVPGAQTGAEPSVQTGAEPLVPLRKTRFARVSHERKAADPQTREELAAAKAARRQKRWQRAGEVLALIGLVLTAICLGLVTILALGSTVWLMIDAKSGNLTQSMSIYTLLYQKALPVLGAGFLGAVALVALCRLVWMRGKLLDGKRGLQVLVGVTFAAQLIIILLIQTRDTLWGDSWMVDDMVTAALHNGIESIFTGPYGTLFYDARLYFSCYPFQATFFWVLYGLHVVFGKYAYMAYQVISALCVELGVVSLVVLGDCLGFDQRARRVNMVLIAACLPMYLLSTFLYANAQGCGLALVFLALQACAMRGTECSKQLKFVAASLIPLALALCVKATFILFALGAVLAWFVIAVRHRSAWCFGATLAVVLLANVLSGLPFEALRAASGGYEFTGPLTTLNHLELGLRMGKGEFYVSIDGGSLSYAPGGWSNYANAIWQEANGDANLQNQWALSALIDDLSDFAVAPDYAAWFFSVKLTSEWSDPTYQSLYYLSMCATANGGRVNPADLSTSLGMLSTFLNFMMDGYQSVLYVGAFGYVIWLIRNWKKQDDAVCTSDTVQNAADNEMSEGTALVIGTFNTRAQKSVALLLTAVFFTGFGCYLLWEAKSVYVLPYAIVLIPLAAAGLSCFFTYLATRHTRA